MVMSGLPAVFIASWLLVRISNRKFSALVVVALHRGPSSLRFKHKEFSMNILSSARSTASPGKLRQFLQRYPLICYFVMAYGFSWLAWIPYVLAQDGLGMLPVHLTQAGLVPG